MQAVGKNRLIWKEGFFGYYYCRLRKGRAGACRTAQRAGQQHHRHRPRRRQNKRRYLALRRYGRCRKRRNSPHSTRSRYRARGFADCGYGFGRAEFALLPYREKSRKLPDNCARAFTAVQQRSAVPQGRAGTCDGHKPRACRRAGNRPSAAFPVGNENRKLLERTRGAA